MKETSRKICRKMSPMVKRELDQTEEEKDMCTILSIDYKEYIEEKL